MTDKKKSKILDRTIGHRGKLGPFTYDVSQRFTDEGIHPYVAKVGTGFVEEGIPVDIGVKKVGNEDTNVGVRVGRNEYVVGKTKDGKEYKKLFIPLNFNLGNVPVNVGLSRTKSKQDKSIDISNQYIDRMIDLGIKQLEDNIGVNIGKNFNINYNKFREAVKEIYKVPRYNIEDTRTGKGGSSNLSLGFVVDDFLGGNLNLRLVRTQGTNMPVQTEAGFTFKKKLNVPKKRKRTGGPVSYNY
tara:strand:- start:1306 stop:2031 length:726 start_codon:yes stop_codon:yes gene_type:complete